MKRLFDELSYKMSKATTHAYSTSFSMGILFLNRKLRMAIYAIYGYVRFADEIVDSFNDYNREELLADFSKQTREAIQNRISLNPILNAFQDVVHRYQINDELIETFLKSMEMDLDKITYSRDKFETYILGSAEVVGLMCLHVFTEGNREQYEALRPYAMKLGAAFQKVNFLRDMKEDYEILGRVYFPDIDISSFCSQKKLAIENDIQEDFDQALEGIRKLPSSSRAGVYLAFVYYKALFNKIKKTPPNRIMQERIRINNGRKLSLMVNSMVQHKMNLL